MTPSFVSRNRAGGGAGRPRARRGRALETHFPRVGPLVRALCCGPARHGHLRPTAWQPRHGGRERSRQRDPPPGPFTRARPLLPALPPRAAARAAGPRWLRLPIPPPSPGSGRGRGPRGAARRGARASPRRVNGNRAPRTRKCGAGRGGERAGGGTGRAGRPARPGRRGRAPAEAPARGGGGRARPRAGPVPPCRAARGRTARDSGQGAWRERAWREGAAGPRAGQQARPPLNIPSGVRSLFVPVGASGAPAPKIATPPPPRPPPPASARRRGARSRSQARWSAPLERGRPPGRSPARTRPRPRAPGERPSGRGPRALARASEGAPHAPRTCRHAAPRKLARARRAACINLEAAPRMPWPPSGDPRGTPWARPAPRCARVRSTRGPPGRSPRRWRGGAAAGGGLPAPRRAEGAMAAYLAASSPPLPPSPP